MYKYQKETLQYLDEVCERLEQLTDNRMSLKIGTIRDEFYSQYAGRYIEKSGDLLIRLNFDERFALEKDDEYCSVFETFDICDGRIRLDKDIFLKLNEWIEKIYKEKHELEEFHERLNLELKALNKVLEA